MLMFCVGVRPHHEKYIWLATTQTIFFFFFFFVFFFWLTTTGLLIGRMLTCLLPKLALASLEKPKSLTL